MLSLKGKAHTEIPLMASVMALGPNQPKALSRALLRKLMAMLRSNLAQQGKLVRTCETIDLSNLPTRFSIQLRRETQV